MAGYNKTSPIIDAMLKLIVTTGTLGVAIVAPNAVQVLDKPLAKFFKSMDKRSRQRELQRLIYYMNQQQLITRDYEHGLKITTKGKQRLARTNLNGIKIAKPKHWDRKWRLIFFDIPEKQKTGRDSLTRKLKDLGFYQLQRSVLVHPFPCREEIMTITAAYGLNRFVSYVETDHIDQQQLLIKKFRNSLSKSRP